MDLLDLIKYWSDSWKRYNLKGVCCCIDGVVTSYLVLEASSEKPGEKVHLGKLAVRGKYTWCLAVVTKFKGLGGVQSIKGMRVEVT